jgi:hypothetical protein
MTSVGDHVIHMIADRQVRRLGRKGSKEYQPQANLCVPRLLTGQERILLGHPFPMVPDRPRPAGLPDAGQAPPLGFVLVGLHPHQHADQVRDLRSPGPLLR